ncbi:MAG TPA: HD domain-containing protein [Rubricoccaceae bacterium]|nr:HD domain-containing protein [Rubricoccaceae bacterium]
MTNLPLPHERVLRRVGAAADRLGLAAYVVGGAVRDALLGRATTDLDFVAVGAGGGIALAEAVAKDLGVGTASVYPSFGTAAVTVPAGAVEGEPERLVLEFVGARRESYRADSRKPIVEDGTLEDDLRRRDFTVNALAVALNAERFGELVDPFGGLADLAAGRLATPLDPRQTFDDDPLRMMRAARFAAQLGFEVDPDALAAMREKAARIGIVSQERVTDELQKTVASARPSLGLRILFETGLLEHVVPELAALAGTEAVGGHGHKDNFYHTLGVLDNLVDLQRARGVEAPVEGRDLWLRWAALLHDIAKPDTKRFVPGQGWTFHGHEDLGPRRHIPRLFRRLRLPLGEPLRYVTDLVRLHHRPAALVDEDVTDSAVRRLLFDAGEDVDDLMTLVRADVTSKNPRRVRRYLAGFDRVEEKMREVEEKDRLRSWQPPVDGHEVMEALGVGEGIAVGIAKAWIREAILEGEIPNEHDAAYAYLLARRDEALRRAALFDVVVRHLRGPERAATGAVKDALFWTDVPADPDEAVAYLLRVKDEALAAREEEADAD